MSALRTRLATAAVLGCIGCSDGPAGGYAPGDDFVRGLSDLVGARDSAGPRDLAPAGGDDLATGDDLAGGDDLATGDDLAIGDDMAAGADLAAGPDLVAAADLAPPADLAIAVAYPPGPYGIKVGDTIAPLAWEGYVDPAGDEVATKKAYVNYAMNDLRRSGRAYGLVHVSAFW